MSSSSVESCVFVGSGCTYRMFSLLPIALALLFDSSVVSKEAFQEFVVVAARVVSSRALASAKLPPGLSGFLRKPLYLLDLLD